MTLTPVLLSMFLQCAPNVAPETLNAVVNVESAGKPFVVANVTDNTSHSFDDKGRAVAFLNSLTRENKNYSAGLMQINSANFKWLGVNNENIFDTCTNIKAGSKVLQQCWLKAKNTESDDQKALRNALSCYYSGNFVRGYKKEKSDGRSYVERIESKAVVTANTVVPAIMVNGQVGVVSNDSASIRTSSFMVTDNKSESWDVFSDYATNQIEGADNGG